MADRMIDLGIGAGIGLVTGYILKPCAYGNDAYKYPGDLQVISYAEVEFGRTYDLVVKAVDNMGSPCKNVSLLSLSYDPLIVEVINQYQLVSTDMNGEAIIKLSGMKQGSSSINVLAVSNPPTSKIVKTVSITVIPQSYIR